MCFPHTNAQRLSAMQCCGNEKGAGAAVIREVKGGTEAGGDVW